MRRPPPPMHPSRPTYWLKPKVARARVSLFWFAAITVSLVPPLERKGPGGRTLVVAVFCQFSLITCAEFMSERATLEAPARSH